MTFPTPLPYWARCSAIEAHCQRATTLTRLAPTSTDLLTSAESWLSTTEKAVVRIAHGCAILERHGGGLPVELRWQVRATVESTTK